MRFICRACGYVFSVENYEGDYEEVTELLPEDFECPACGAPAGMFEPEEKTTDA